MLGLADREAVFELMEAVMGGKPAAALAVTDRAYERGADHGTLLQDLLELLHTVTRLKSIPGLRHSQDLPEAERTRGAELADRLSVPVLARAWQMLLKGVGEVETAPDRRAAAEMVLIRLCHVADMPTPGDLIRRLTSGGGERARRLRSLPVVAAACGRWPMARRWRKRRRTRGLGWARSAMSSPLSGSGRRRCCTRICCIPCTWFASPRR